jgi:epoxide hydrolase-like predicted phosphatase
VFTPGDDPRTPAKYHRTVELRGVITDWGGVLTNPIAESVNAWLEADGIDRDSYVTVMRQWVSQAYGSQESESPIHALERGESTHAEFELALGSQLKLIGGGPVPVDGLLTRMWAGSRRDQEMLDLFRRLKAAGVPTGLLSNSWGSDYGYPRELFPEMFNVVVISAEVGMRKPEPRIFLHVAGLLGLEPGECVFIDDIQQNITVAEELGFTGILHTDAASTALRVSELLGIDF